MPPPPLYVMLECLRMLLSHGSVPAGYCHGLWYWCATLESFIKREEIQCLYSSP